MAQYYYNPDTMLYEEQVRPKRHRVAKRVAMVVVFLGLIVFYVWMYTSVLGLDLPKTAILKKRHAIWEAKMELLDLQLDLYDQTLFGIEERDDNVYRSIYGLSAIPDEIKNAGFGGVNRYEYLDRLSANSDLKDCIKRIDVLTKRTYIQSQALDEVEALVMEAGDMLSCVPSVPPILPKKGSFRMSSSFGGRRDPVYGGYEYHNGQDFATAKGNPVYATGDGIVVTAQTRYGGYGNEIVIDHGYGYKTRYAHLNTLEVREGMKVQRGERIGTVGNTGKSTGSHLHYEVEYRGKKVNPMKYMDINMSVDEYSAMVSKRNDDVARDKKSTTTELLKRRRR
ncbi:MAG: M23 family metallopeptidase [Bacteroidales bacterium]|nr:M23 family metallopeptidase [Bacteroidales bacterium]